MTRDAHIGIRPGTQYKLEKNRFIPSQSSSCESPLPILTFPILDATKVNAPDGGHFTGPELRPGKTPRLPFTTMGCLVLSNLPHLRGAHFDQ